VHRERVRAREEEQKGSGKEELMEEETSKWTIKRQTVYSGCMQRDTTRRRRGQAGVGAPHDAPLYDTPTHRTSTICAQNVRPGLLLSMLSNAFTLADHRR